MAVRVTRDVVERLAPWELDKPAKGQPADPKPSRPTPDSSVPPSPPGAWTIDIPGFRPTSLNVVLRMHWAKRNRHNQTVDAQVAVSCYQAGVPRATRKRRVSLRVEYAKRPGRWLDEDNAYKGLLDALVSCGALVDDGPDWVERGRYEPIATGRKATTITLEDME